MNYEMALKKIREDKPKDNYIAIKLGYEIHMVLPYKDGLNLIESIKNAEKFNKAYNPDRIGCINRSFMEITIMSRHEYEQFKIAGLLNITLEQALALQIPVPVTES